MPVEYTSISQREHVLKRPGMYIGETVLKQYTGHIIKTLNPVELEYRTYEIIPGLLKLFNESLDNAKDNIPRSIENNTPQKFIKVNVNDWSVTIQNDGHIIPVTKNAKGEWIPTMIFGTLLSGSNYNDSEDRTCIGTNGLGIKLVVIFSTQFTVEIKDPVNKMQFTQTWKNNMEIVEKPSVSKYTGKTGLVKVMYTLDTTKFKQQCNKLEFHKCIETQVIYTACMFDNIKVYYNENQIKMSQKNLFKLYDTNVNIISMPNFTLGIGLTFTPGSYSLVSFVNGTMCARGGKHTDIFITKISKYIAEFIKKKTKRIVQPSFVKNYITLYCIATVINPQFDSQTKEYVTFDTKTSVPDIPETFLKKLTTSEIVTKIMEDISAKESSKLEKLNTPIKVKIPKYTHANYAGVYPDKCTLFITEGDSANAMCVHGIETIKKGHDFYGSFPIRGKILNVRDTSTSAILANAEIQNIIKILNLQMKEKYELKNGKYIAGNGQVLRYSTLAVMSDQDTDGFHIKGLILNFIGYFWPSLLELGFVKTFITPIVKVLNPSKQVLEISGKNKVGVVINNSIVFFSLPDIDKFSKLTDLSKLKLKYYKGLGTSNASETKDYFSNLGLHIIKFAYASPDDFLVIDMAFNKKRADDRKKWILGEFLGNPQDPDYTHDQQITNFVRDELSQYSKDNLERSIPALTDGLKPSQRKIIYTAFLKNLTNKDREIRVSQFAGMISTETMYHHGEVSLEGAIVNLAQHFVGSNNINLLVDDGMFGSRNQGGNDSAASRYIQTYLSDYAKQLFSNDDNDILEYLYDEGQKIEPKTLLPILPLLLINGSTGIGTGWSTNIPCFNTNDIIAYIKAKLTNKPTPKVHVFYNGFKGQIKESKDSFETYGVITQTKSGYSITELPIQVWTEDYKTYLVQLIEKSQIKNYEEHHENGNLRFEIIMTPNQRAAVKDPIEFFRLKNKFSLKNMTCWVPSSDTDSLKINVFTSVYDILDTWITWRLNEFTKRKNSIITKINAKSKQLENIIRFITSVIKKQLIVFERKVNDVVKDLIKMKFDEINGSYDYLLNLRVQVFTEEQIQKLQSEYNTLQTQLKTIVSKTESDLFVEDIDSFAKIISVV